MIIVAMWLAEYMSIPDDVKCEPKNKKIAFFYFIRNAKYRIPFQLLIILWLIWVTIETKKIINTGIEEVSEFKGRIRKIMVINWAFVAAYSIDMLYDLALIFINEDDNANEKLLLRINLLILIISVYLPIGVVFLNHFKNILSVHRVFCMFWRKKNDDTIDASDEAERQTIVQLLCG